MTTLHIASKANQATTLPALLVASYVKESAKDAAVDIRFEELESLKSEYKASVELVLGSATPVYGSEQSIHNLVKAFPFLRGKNENLVRIVTPISFQPLNYDLRLKNGSKERQLSIPQTLSRWRVHYLNSTLT